MSLRFGESVSRKQSKRKTVNGLNIVIGSNFDLFFEGVTLPILLTNKL